MSLAHIGHQGITKLKCYEAAKYEPDGERRDRRMFNLSSGDIEKHKRPNNKYRITFRAMGSTRYGFSRALTQWKIGTYYLWLMSISDIH